MAQGKPAVALVASSYFPRIGGVEHHTAQVARELMSRGHQVEVWTVASGALTGAREVDGVTVRHLSTPLPHASPQGALRFFLHMPVALRQWVSAFRAFRPDVLHVQCFGPNGAYAVMLARLTGTPFVISSHGETRADDHNVFDRSATLRAALRYGVAHASAVTAVAEDVAKDLRDRFGAASVRIVGNGVRVDRRGTRPVPPDRKLVLSAGRLEENKGFDLLVRAVSLLPSVRLVIVGEGSQHHRLEALASSLGMSERVSLVGPRTPSQVVKAMSGADVVVVPSRKEAFGIVVLEAWAAGTPVVATAIAGPAAFVTDRQDGLLVDPRDQRALAGALREILQDDVLWERLSNGGSRSVTRYTWGSVVDAYVRLYPVPVVPAPGG